MIDLVLVTLSPIILIIIITARDGRGLRCNFPINRARINISHRRLGELSPENDRRARNFGGILFVARVSLVTSKYDSA